MGGLGAAELAILFAVLMLFVGARKLPDLARGSGQALRILRSEARAAAEDERVPRD